MTRLMTALLITAAVACGSGGTNPGSGTGTLLVTGDVDNEGGNAAVSIRVRKNNADVTTALVTVESNLGSQVLPHVGGGVYSALMPGWGNYYSVLVEYGDDHLEGSIATPIVATITSPNPGVVFDPHLAPNGSVLLQWSGSPATQVRVRSNGGLLGNFDSNWVSPDRGELTMPATVFDDNTREIRIERVNKVSLVGGVGGSELSAWIESKTTLVVTNPF